MASYFDELHVEEDEIPTVRIERLTRETFRMLFDHDPARYGDIINFQNTPPASKSEIEKLKAPSFEELIGINCITKYFSVIKTTSHSKHPSIYYNEKPSWIGHGVT